MGRGVMPGLVVCADHTDVSTWLMLTTMLRNERDRAVEAPTRKSKRSKGRR